MRTCYWRRDLDFLACANSLAPAVLIVAGLSAQGENNGAAVTAVGILVLAFVFITNFVVFLRVRAMAKQAAEFSEEAGKRASQQGSGALAAALAAITGLCSCFCASGRAREEVSEAARGGVQMKENQLSLAFSFSDHEKRLQQMEQQVRQGRLETGHYGLPLIHVDAEDEGEMDVMTDISSPGLGSGMGSVPGF